MRNEMIFEINVNVAESYLCGVAKRTNGDMRLISRGRTGIALPKELIYSDLGSCGEALLNIRTNSGIVPLRSRVQIGEDMIDIFDYGLLEKLTLKEPQTMEILLLESSDVLQ
jgi:hypothetical protein